MKIVLAVLAWFLLLDLVWAHSWYPRECCQEGDCRPIECNALTEETRINPHGFPIEIIVYSAHGKKFYAVKDKMQPSPDGRCHACFWSGTFNMRCVFVPQKVS